MDHVGLGEHGAATGDGRRFARAADDAAHVFDIVEEAVGLLIHERTGACGAVTVGLIVGDAHPARVGVDLELDELRSLSTHLEHRGDLGMEDADGTRDCLELVLDGGPETPGDESGPRAGGPDTRDEIARYGLEHFGEQAARRLRGAPEDASVAGHQHGRKAGGHRCGADVAS